MANAGKMSRFPFTSAALLNFDVSCEPVMKTEGRDQIIGPKFSNRDPRERKTEGNKQIAPSASC